MVKVGAVNLLQQQGESEHFCSTFDNPGACSEKALIAQRDIQAPCGTISTPHEDKRLKTGLLKSDI